MAETLGIGDYVRHAYHGTRGRVYQIFSSFAATREGQTDIGFRPDGTPFYKRQGAWLNAQSAPITDADLAGPWYAVLVRGGGSIQVPASHLERVEWFALDNAYESVYLPTGQPEVDETREHVVLVAFTVTGAENRREAEGVLSRALRPVRTVDPVDMVDGRPIVDSWWIAEDDRNDGSDNDSAVFVHPGSQAKAAVLLHQHGLTSACNIVGREVNGQWE